MSRYAVGVKRLILLALSLVLGSCGSTKPGAPEVLHTGFDKLRATAQANIADSERRDTYLRLAVNMQVELLAFEKYAAGYVEEYRRAFTDHATDAEALRQLTSEFRARQRKTQDRFVELHLAMADSVTEQEWPALSKQETAMVEQLLKAAQGGR